MEVEMGENQELKWDWEDEEAAIGGGWLLIGKLFAAKRMNRSVFEDLVRRAWAPKGRVEINPAGDNLFFFVFEAQKDFDRIIRDSPWTIAGHLLNLQSWSPLLTIEEVDMTRCQFWVQVHKVPRAAMSKRNILRMGSQIGEVICFEDPKLNDSLFRSFVRIRVNVDISKPLVAGFWIPRPQMDKVWAQVRYEKLQAFCFACGVIGHEMNDCGLSPVMAEFDPSQSLYSANLGVRPMRAVAAIVKMNGGVEGSVEVEVAREASSSRQSVGDNLRTGVGGVNSVSTGLQMMEGSGNTDGMSEDKMDLSANIKEVGRVIEAQLEEEEVTSPAKKEAGGPRVMDMALVSDPIHQQEKSPLPSLGQHERVADASLKTKQGGPVTISYEGLRRETKLMGVVEGGSQLAARRVLFREGDKWKEKQQHVPYIVEMPSDEDSDRAANLQIVKAEEYEGLLIEELTKVCLKRKVAEDWEVPVSKRKKEVVFQQGDATAEGVEDGKRKAGRPRRKGSRGKALTKSLIEVPILELASGTRFDVLATLPEEFVFSAEVGSGGRPLTTTQGP